MFSTEAYLSRTDIDFPQRLLVLIHSNIDSHIRTRCVAFHIAIIISVDSFLSRHHLFSRISLLEQPRWNPRNRRMRLSLLVLETWPTCHGVKNTKR